MDIPLQLHEFYPLNHVEKCPTYTETLLRLEFVQFSDLDALYTDLETLQGAANIRLRKLEEEVKILSEWCDLKDRLKSDVDLNFTNSITSKRTRSGQVDECKVLKKQKMEEPAKVNISKGRSKSKPTTDSSDNDVCSSKPKLAYEAPNKFWSYVEPYCSDILPEQITAIEESLSTKAEISEYYKMPALGVHYSDVWNKEDFLEEQQQSAKIDKKRSSPISNVNLTERLNNDSALLTEKEECSYGSFTQRLISALVDENIMAPVCEKDLHDAVKLDSNKTEIRPHRNLSNNNHSKSLESAIKEELYSLGLIDSLNEEENKDDDDEILMELRRLQSELKAVRSHNKHCVSKLVARAKIAMKKQEVRQKAKILDAEVVDIFRKFSSSKAKKKGLSRKDREMAWKVYNERKALWEIVDSEDAENKVE
ncbi:transcriptional adapter 3-A [Hydra vulgaris]|uniref:Transcriptional adapter 3-A n=1 Tax=Hydra vulgaris TaxID=6087 RepID=A0ABM4D1Y8_HYDVU